MLSADAADFRTRLMAHLKLAKKGDYVAVTAYVERTAAREKLLREIRTLIRDRFGVATTVGYGPRFLHSTGQLHKGGAANGVFVQLSAEPAVDLPIPGERFGFGVLEAAQALGDYESLAKRGRRAIRVALGEEVDAGLRAIVQALNGGAARGAAAPGKKPVRSKAPARAGARRKGAAKSSPGLAAGKTKSRGLAAAKTRSAAKKTKSAAKTGPAAKKRSGAMKSAKTRAAAKARSVVKKASAKARASAKKGARAGRGRRLGGRR
jgi:hypothetical protein